MRHTQSEKMEIIRTVEGSRLGVKRTLAELDAVRSTTGIAAIVRVGTTLCPPGRRSAAGSGMRSRRM
jgi:hypothetical protein